MCYPECRPECHPECQDQLDMVRSHTVMVWTHYLSKKSLVVVSGGGWQTNFGVSPGPGLWSLVFGPSGPDLGPGPDLTWDLELDNRKRVSLACKISLRSEMRFLK